LYRDNWADVYSGAMDALVAAGLASMSQFPGRPGCGKVRTTFNSDGMRVAAGSHSAKHEGCRTVSAAGSRFEVSIRVCSAEGEIRRARRLADWDLRSERAEQEVAAMFLQHQTQPPRHHLRLVWSA
jgi:hypothetical protein